jgi:integrase
MGVRSDALRQRIEFSFLTDKESLVSLSVKAKNGACRFSLPQVAICRKLQRAKAIIIMPGRQAKTLSSADVNDLLLFASCTRNPLRNCVIVLLSAKAGLRASEIANLTWDMVLGPTGQISGIIELRDHAAKKGGGRVSPFIRNCVPRL